jgi:catechol 2,3-dioxygenase-like lactoylglutathione lyase family enzyme
MFKDTAAFSSFSVDDVGAAKRFYGETLAIAVEDGPMGTLGLHLAGGGDVMVYPKPDHAPAVFTVLNFQVDDIEAAVDALAERGVTFERYDGLEADEQGIHRDAEGPAIAWFTDPAGNIISVLQP